MADQIHEDATQVLVRGVKEGDLALVKEALKSPVDFGVTTPCSDGINRTLLGLASYLGHAHLVKPLASAGVDVEGRGSRYFTPLLHATREMHVEVIRELLEVGADINAVTAPREVRNSVLHVSAMRGDEASVALLLSQRGLNISPQDDLGYTPLHVAARINHIPIIDRLVEAGAELHLCTVHGWTPLHIASMSGSIDAIKRLLELGLDLYAVDKEDRTPRDLADELGMTEVYWFFIKKAGQAESTVLTPPQKCEKRYDIENWLLDWAKDGSDGVLPMLEKNQPDPFDGYYQDRDGYTTLHHAAERGNDKAVKVLLEDCFIYPGVLNQRNETPADLARAQGHQDLAEYIESFFRCPQTRQEAEALYFELLELIGQGDDVRAASQLLFKGAPFKPIGQHSTHALIIAITANRRRILTLLIAAGAPLTTVFQGLNILQISWVSPQVSTYIRMIITRITAYMLEEELSKVDASQEKLRDGIVFLLEKVRSNTPWIARWPDAGVPSAFEFIQQLHCHNNETYQNLTFDQPSNHLTHLLVQAVRAGCSMTAAFLQQAGGIPFAVDGIYGETPFTAALKCKHLNIAGQIAKTSAACHYIPNASGDLPRDFLSEDCRRGFEDEMYDREAWTIDNEREKAKNDRETTDDLERIQQLHRKLYEIYILEEGTTDISTELGAKALLMASQLGLSQFIHLLLKVACLDVNLRLESLMGTTALHQAAAFGHSDLCTLLIRRGALIDQKDYFKHTPPHFAAMFGHEAAYQQLATFVQNEELRNCTNNTPDSVRTNFYTLLDQYNVLEIFLQQADDVFTCNDPGKAEREKLDQLSLSYLVSESASLCVDFKKGEAAKVKAVVMAELEVIKEKIARLNPLYTGSLELLGSAADNTRLHAPDEFDFNFCVDMAGNLEVRVVHWKEKEALLSNHPKGLQVTSEDPEIRALLCNSNWKDGFYKAVVQCFEDHSFSDHHLSLVPPGITRTQVGVGISLSWQGDKYPLLLIGIDLVPVLKADWPKDVEMPYLTPEHTNHVYISSIGEGKWRLSFANLEANVLKSLQPEELYVYLTCKTLLSCMKAEPWMPKAIKNKFTWWNSRRWKIPIPSGFALKNCFLQRLEEKRKNRTSWKKDDLACHMLNVFRLMVEEEFYEVTGVTGLVSKSIFPYFGGNFEIPKLGEGSLEIIRYLEKHNH